MINRDDQWIIWCGLNSEQDMLERMLGNDCVSIRGNQDAEERADLIDQFIDGDKRILISKPRVLGFGMNFQNAHNMIFFGLNDSWESYFQCIRREWRFGQKQPVNIYVVLSELEREIYTNIMHKERAASELSNELIKRIKGYEMEEIKAQGTTQNNGYLEDTVRGDGWTAMLGDSTQRLAELTENSIDLSVYSPPFADLYTYSNSERDLGNSRNWDEFFDHYAFVIREILRATKPGRLTCVHTADIPAMDGKDGYIGLKDFPGRVIAAYENEGWIFHARATIDKNPQAQALRTKSKGLLFAQMEKDSIASRPGIGDQILVFRKPGDNAVPVNPVKNGDLSRMDWILWARPIWYAADYEPGSFDKDSADQTQKSGYSSPDGIRETETLQFTTARDQNDEKHICPLQLGTIERCIKLWSNPGETVLTPFGGIGSEAYQAVKFRRKAVLIELKESYFRVAVKNLQQIEREIKIPDLFEFAGLQVS